MPEEASVLAPHFDDLPQQRDASTLGMWVFLAAEVIFFGGVIFCFCAYRIEHPREFGVASNHTKIALGTINTAVLLSSSLTMALAVQAAQKTETRRLVRLLVTTMGLGAAFLAIKFTEYYLEDLDHLVPGPHFYIEGANPRGAQLFFGFYFVMTGIHALHLLIGIVVLGVVAVKAERGRYARENFNTVEVSGLYWHFVDLVWIFLFPLLYLLSRHVHYV